MVIFFADHGSQNTGMCFNLLIILYNQFKLYISNLASEVFQA